MEAPEARAVGSAAMATRAKRRARGSAGGGVEGLGQTGGAPSAFDEFRRMEDKIETAEHTVLAQSEVDAALAGPSPSGMSRAEVEAKFRELESGASSDPAAPAKSEVDDELSALKKKIRIET